MGLEDNVEKLRLFLILTVPQQFCWNASWVGQKRMILPVYRWDTAGIKKRCNFSALSHSHDTELNWYVRIFENSSVQLRTVAFFAGLQLSEVPILGVLLAQLPKIIHLSKHWTLISEAKFDVDYDFSIKYGLGQWYHQLMDVQSWRRKWPKTKKAVLYLKQMKLNSWVVGTQILCCTSISARDENYRAYYGLEKLPPQDSRKPWSR